MSFSGNTPLVGSMIAGKYRLIRRLGVGGMGDVYLARVEGMAGFEKHVAVKLLHEHLVGEQMVMESFLAEARLAANLSHANIAQLYDLGQSDGMYFIAMEYVSGLDLRALMAEAGKREERLPIPLCCYVVARLCDGLDHAHRKRDGSGRPLKLVHRDVSPSNVLVSFSGEVKLIDFGIAKAAGEDSRTRTGMIKGKTAYLSPEQVQGWQLDRRSDLFSVGIVLYELLCGPRPFAGESELSVMEAIRDVRYQPPSELDPDLPAGLNAIVTKALAKDLQARYQWAGELVTDLEGYLFSRGELISARDVAEYVKGLVGGTRAVLAAEVLSPDPEPPTGSTRSLKSRSRARVPPAKPPEPTQVTATPERPASAVPTEVGPPPPPPPEPPTQVDPPAVATQIARPPERLPTHGHPVEPSMPTGTGSAATLPSANSARPLRLALVLVAFAIAGGVGYGWQRLRRVQAPAGVGVEAAGSGRGQTAAGERTPTGAEAPPAESGDHAPAGTNTPPAAIADRASTGANAPPAAVADRAPTGTNTAPTAVVDHARTGTPPGEVADHAPAGTNAPPAAVADRAPTGTNTPPAAVADRASTGTNAPSAAAADRAPTGTNAPSAADGVSAALHRAPPAPDQTTVAAVKPAAVRSGPRAPTSPKPATASATSPKPAVARDSAYLNLRSNRPAEIVVDGKTIGKSPQVHFALPPGRHEVRFDCLYDWGKAKGEVQSLYLVPFAEGDVTHECVEIARP